MAYEIYTVKYRPDSVPGGFFILERLRSLKHSFLALGILEV